MIFTETPIAGAFVIEPEAIRDNRGFFARTWCSYEFERHGLNPRLVQCSTSFNSRKGTLRGLHYQTAPHLEAKLVRCTRGAAFDVVVDVRMQSPTFGQWYASEISDTNGRMMYVPEGVAHGFQTLVDDTELFYQISTFYAPEFASGLRWNDPDIGISWPFPAAPILSGRDARLPFLNESVDRPLRKVAI